MRVAALRRQQREGRLNRITLFVIAAAFFMEGLDATVALVAIPAIARELQVDLPLASFGVSAYMLAAAIGISASGWLAERFSARRVFLVGMVAFGVGSLMCGLSIDFKSFLLARTCQGFGGAMTVPIARLILYKGTSKAELVASIALITWPSLIAPIVGPLLGGFIASNVGWRWVFFVNVPLALCVGAMAWKCLDSDRDDASPDFDWAGFALIAISVSSLLVFLRFCSSVQPSLAAFAFAVSVVSVSLSIYHLNRSSAPLLNLSVFAVPSFAVSVGGGALYRMAIGGFLLLTQLILQSHLGLTALKSGTLMSFFFIGNIVLQPAMSMIMARWGFRRVLFVNAFLTGLLLLACVAIAFRLPLVLVAILLLLMGACRAVQFTALNAVALADISRPTAQHAISISALSQQLFTGLGVSITAASLSFAVNGLGRFDHIPYTFALVAAACVACFSGALSGKLPHGAGDQVSHFGRPRSWKKESG